ncbi:helix-turn-helix domain-containing protein [Pseudorhodoplanes sinuspersici]|uniref:Uncharacterized protein n=1 Tax=Pseudorhodoplanes sinuspersici TaxID=1235591 RepID=A0A1W6ZN77_9HYPH|nr:helix-turn-helix domain-containing protein [Pseudorhodoplanes sinuspersici]ARP98244.1 hypothetical protein CAK95_03420 [Pseudorhodoplanes sinuspersici]RKE67999.1 helix-turn-helix protein [Pseudorhodoplanes sinuspersici]
MIPSRKPRQSDDLLNEIEASDILRVSVRTLQSWRCGGAGPAFIRIGRAIRYRYSDLLAYVDQNVVRPQNCLTKDPDTQRIL